MRSLTRVFLLAGISSFAAVAPGQANTAPTVSVKVDKPTVVAQKMFKATLTVTFADGLHGYQNPPSTPELIPVRVTTEDKTFTIISVSYPKGTPTKMAGEDKPISIYSGAVKIVVTFKAPVKPGKTTLKLSISYQQCNDTSCYPPGAVSAGTPLTVAKALKAKS